MNDFMKIDTRSQEDQTIFSMLLNFIVDSL